MIDTLISMIRTSLSQMKQNSCPDVDLTLITSSNLHIPYLYHQLINLFMQVSKFGLTTHSIHTWLSLISDYPEYTSSLLCIPSTSLFTRLHNVHSPHQTQLPALHPFLLWTEWFAAGNCSPNLFSFVFSLPSFHQFVDQLLGIFRSFPPAGRDLVLISRSTVGGVSCCNVQKY